MAGMSAATAPVNGIELCFETFGDPKDPALLLVMGLGAQMIAWDPEFCEGLVDRGFYVIRYDNRDVGLSTKLDDQPVSVIDAMTKAAGGEPIAAPYTLSDMAADAVALLDHLGIDKAHIVGASMGGMIVQAIAIEHPERVLTMTSIMSTTGEVEYGQATPEALAQLTVPPPADREAAIDQGVAAQKVIGSPAHFDEDRTRAKAGEAYDRSFYPAGFGRQLVGIMASGSRADGLRNVKVPTLVVHGDADPLVTPTGGQRTAELVPGAELLMIEGMGHDLPVPLWPQVIEAITNLATKAAS
jgi:pimeloyl-ACP methyl ester carboxylesterase